MITNETLKTIKNRRSNRSFQNEQIKTEELEAVLEAGRYAPSAGNQQAWHFTVIQNKDLLDRLSRDGKHEALKLDEEHVQKMAGNEKFHIFYDAPTVIVVSGAEQAMMIESDCGAATQNMLLAAEAIGLGACWVDFVLFAFNLPQGAGYLKELGIPNGYRPYSSVALGYKKIQVLNAPARKQDTINYVK